MSKRGKQRRRRKKAQRPKLPKQRSPMPPPCQTFGDGKKAASKAACRGRVTEE